MSESKSVSREIKGLLKASTAGVCNDEMRRDVAEWLREMDGRQIFAYVKELDRHRTIGELEAMCDKAME